MDWLGDLGRQTGEALQGVGTAVGDGAKWTENAAKSALPTEVPACASRRQGERRALHALRRHGRPARAMRVGATATARGMGGKLAAPCAGQNRVYQDPGAEGGGGGHPERARRASTACRRGADGVGAGACTSARSRTSPGST